MTKRLALRRKILMVETLTDIVSAVRRGRFFRHISDNIWLLSPFKIIPFESRINIVRKINRILLAIWIKRAIRKTKIENAILYYTTYDDHELPEKIPHSLIIYDCYDLHEAFSWATGEELELERRLLKNADVVTASSQKLVETLREKGFDSILIRNAADVEFFKTVRNPGSIHQSIINIEHPRIGFVGYLADWVDMDLLDYLAIKRPKWNVILAGKRNVGDHPLFHRPNVTYLGVVPYSELPSLLRGFNVCVVPFKVGPLTQAADTIKMFEYLSAGKPVVSSAIQQAKEFSSLVSIANSKEEFLQMIESIVSNPSKHLPENLDNFLSQHDWNDRARLLNQLIDEALNQDKVS